MAHGEDVEMEGRRDLDLASENQDEEQNQQKRYRRDSSSVGSVEAPPGLGQGQPPQEISMFTILEAIQKGEHSNNQRHTELKRDLGRMDRELKDVKNTAAKALFTSTEAKQEISSLKERMDKIEKEGYAASSVASTFSGGAGSFHSASDRGRPEIPAGNTPRPDLLGGATGGELMVGGFPAWTRKAQIILWGDEIVKPALSEELRGRLEGITAPGKRGSILVLKISAAETKFETRKYMFQAVKVH